MTKKEVQEWIDWCRHSKGAKIHITPVSTDTAIEILTQLLETMEERDRARKNLDDLLIGGGGFSGLGEGGVL